MSLGQTRFNAAQQVLNAIGAQFPATQGRIIFCRPGTGSDGRDGSTPQKAVKTLAQALSLATANQNDIVAMMAESNTASATTDYQSTVLDWNKDGVHLIGVNAGPMLGQRSRIANLSTADAIVNGLFILSANGCLIQNIQVIQEAAGTNPTGASIAMVVSGMRNVIRNCQISGNADPAGTLDDATSRSLKVSGSENLFDHCYIGLDTVLRATQTTECEISAGTRNIFERCHFNSWTSLSTFKAVSIATGCDRFVKFVDCDFTAVQNITSAVAPTGAIGITTMNGQVIMRNPYVYGYANIVTADNTYVKVLGLLGVAPASGNLIGIAQSVDII